MMNSNFSRRYTKERRVCTSITILIDGSIVMWNKKPNDHHNGGWAQLIERERWPSIAILPEGSAIMWSKKYVTPVSLNYNLVYTAQTNIQIFGLIFVLPLFGY